MALGLFFGLLLGMIGIALALVWQSRRPAAPDGPDAAELVTRLLEANRVVLEQERLRAGAELNAKKSLIDQQLGTMNAELGKVNTLVRELEQDRRHAFGQLTNELQRQHEGL